MCTVTEVCLVSTDLCEFPFFRVSQARQTQKDLPKDDEEIDRKEQVDIDKGFVESSSSEDELTDKGKHSSSQTIRILHRKVFVLLTTTKSHQIFI